MTFCSVMERARKENTVVPIPEIIIDRNTETIYERGKFYGKGAFGRCYGVEERKTNRTYAAKIIPRRLLVEECQKRQVAQEISIQRRLRHKNIVAYHGTFEDDNFVYILLELCHRGSLAALHNRRKTLTEPETRYFMKQILEGTQYLHKVGVVHRDLKLGNLLLDDHLDVKIGDFGLAANIEYKGQRRKTLCGTPNYVAPEILQKKSYSFEVDIWSIGCVLYTLLVGKPPFEMHTVSDTCERIKRCHYTLPSSLRADAATLISQLLQPDPTKRPKIPQILKSYFFKGYVPSALPLTCLTVAPRTDTIIANESLALLHVNCARNSKAAVAAPFSEVQDKQAARKRLPESNVTTESPKKSPANSAPPGGVFKRQRENVPPRKESRLEIRVEPDHLQVAREPRLEVIRLGDCSKELQVKKATSHKDSDRPPSAMNTANTCRKYLEALQKQLNQMFDIGLHTIPAVEEELTDPAARPIIWVAKWMDFTQKYGFGYQLSDDTLAVMFNDDTSLVLLADHWNIHYIEYDGTENYYTMDSTPKELAKKMKLLTYFGKYMREELERTGGPIAVPESGKYALSRAPYLYHWSRNEDAVTMQLTNGTIQMNFKDHTKIIMCPLMKAVTYIEPENSSFRTYKFSTIIRNGCNPVLLYALSYARQKIENLIRSAN